jgi:hypothetical protein
VRQIFTECKADKMPESWKLYKQAQWRYIKEVRNAPNDAWSTFCNSTNDLPMSARLHRSLSKDSRIKMGSLMAPPGRCMQSKGETLLLLLVTHFPNLVITEKVAVPAAAHCAKRLDWRVAVWVVTYRRVEWAIDSFAPYRSSGMDGIFPSLLKEGWKILVPYLVLFLRACLGTGYVQPI